MARRKLIEYLNDPSLLHTISEEEMIAWAAEVPYAGLVQRLLAQKLAIESSEDHLAERANTMAIISNANPDHTIRSIEDFKQLVLKGGDGDVDKQVDEPKEELPIITTGHGVSDEVMGLTDHATPAEVEEATKPIEELSKEDVNELTKENTEKEAPAKSEKKTSSVPVLGDKEEESEFSNWLAGLQALEAESEDEGTPIQLKEKALASEPLVELLVSQGHYRRAIEMYELLILKYPQKSSFFAAQIEKVKAL